MPATLPDPCATAIASVQAALSIPIQGVDNVPTATSPSCVPDAVAAPTSSSSAARTRRQSLPASAVANGYYTQSTNCATVAPIFMIAQSGFTLTDKDCATVMPIRQYHVYIYYIAPCSVAYGTGGACQAGDPPLPTLKRVDLVPGACRLRSRWSKASRTSSTSTASTLPESDGSPDTYTAGPASVTQWSQVVAVRVHLLARNVDATPGFTDTKTYAMGNNADGTANTVTPGGSSGVTPTPIWFASPT